LTAAGPVHDRYFEQPDLACQQLRGDLRVHGEAVALDVQVAVQLRRHQLQAGRVVADVRVEQDVHDRRHELVALDIPVGEGRVAAERAVAVDHLRLAGKSRLEQSGYVLGPVFQVGVEE